MLNRGPGRSFPKIKQKLNPIEEILISVEKIRDGNVKNYILNKLLPILRVPGYANQILDGMRKELLKILDNTEPSQRNYDGLVGNEIEELYSIIPKPKTDLAV